MELKPTLFIGSSKEGLEVARLVKTHLSEFADCRIWNEDVFELNQSYFDTLKDVLNLYEYGVLIGTADDLQISRGEERWQARDNVLFEFGMFLGRLGTNKVFFLKESGTKIPSDLSGIALLEFSSKMDNLEAQIRENCRQIIHHITQKSSGFDGGLFPSLPLAFGYFHNSIIPLCQQLTRNPVAKIEGETCQIQDFQVEVLIPDQLPRDVKEIVEVMKAQKKWRQIEIPNTDRRSYIFYCVPTEHSSTEKITIYDIPTTLNALNQTIDEFVGRGRVGKDIKVQLVEQREIRYFRRVVDHLCQGSAFTRARVITQIVSG